jgi:uncharacterized repeat protein (TIGR03803 family)
MKNHYPRRAAGLALFVLSAISGASQCLAGTLRTIYAFPSPAAGFGPVSNLVVLNGVIYGNTGSGGVGCTEVTYGCGTLFQFDPATGTESVLHSFLFAPDGGFPETGPLYVDGVFYGATQQGGADYGGLVYAYNPVTNTESVVVNFNGANGVNPGLGSLAAHNGVIYGVTSQGGTDNQGVIYKLDTATGKQAVLYNFVKGPSGYEPNAGILYHDGYLYGTTSYGGSKKQSLCYYGCGTLYKFDLATKTPTVLFGFKNDRSGGFPYRDTLIYQDGVLYGVTVSGGAINNPNCLHITGCGVVYKYDLAADKLSVLYRFHGGRDGNFPVGSLVYAGGNLYGTTIDGGNEDHGTVYEVNASTGAETVLHRFSPTGAKDGTQPFGGLTYYHGKLYGTTGSGGDLGGECGVYGCGTIFELKP